MSLYSPFTFVAIGLVILSGIVGLVSGTLTPYQTTVLMILTIIWIKVDNSG